MYEEVQKNWRAAFPSLMFGRYKLENFIERDRYGAANAGHDYWTVVEAMWNNTGANIVHGCPIIRCSLAGGGADQGVYNTYVAGGADSGTSTDGCFLNFAGISALMTKDEAAGNTNRQLFLSVPDLTVIPAVGALITQAATGNTGTVLASSIVYNYIQVLDLNTGAGVAWNATALTDAGATMTPAAPTVRNLVYGTLDANGNFEGNGDMFQDGTGMWVVVRGYTPAFIQGDDAGLGYNGDIADCTPLTWNDDVIALCAAYYQNVADVAGGTVDILVTPDNVIAHSMQAIADNSGHTPELALIYVRAEEPLVYTLDAGQGTSSYTPQA